MLGAFALGFIGYFASEFALAERPHPMHWLVMAIAGVVGYGSGYVWPTVQERWSARTNPGPRRRSK